MIFEAAWNLVTYPLQWLFRCRGCGCEGWPGIEGHLAECPKLWRNGGEITGSGDGWHKAHGWTREESRRGYQ